MSKTIVNPMEESRRRYYLEAMGVQCWESLESPEPVAAHGQSPVTEEQVVPEVVQDREVASSPWSTLQSSIDECKSCGLHLARRQALVGRGNPQADLVFVLLSPAGNDDAANMLCSGEAGALLTKMLSAIGLSIDDVYLTSLLKCAPTESHTVSPSEISACDSHLKQQLALIQPKVIIVLGEVAARCMLQQRLSIDDFRAMNTTDDARYDGLPLFVSYSPQELLLQAGHKRKAWEDLQQLQQFLKN